MKQYKFYFLLLSFLFINACGIKQAKISNSTSTTDKFQTILDSIYHANPDAIGIMAHIEAPRQNISWSGASGLSNKETASSIQFDQPALIASNVKMYVSVSILRLVEEGKIKLDNSIEKFLTNKTKEVLTKDGYQLKDITVAHLLSHTSGIRDYVTENYFTIEDKDPSHRWTRDEQIKLATTVGDPLGNPGFTFSYADVNYLLLTEVIEHATGKNFYTAIRDLINYKKHQLNSTWFFTLDEKPKGVKPLVHQYFGEYNWDAYDIDPSWDLYGGGGIASTTKDLARFSQLLFEGKIIENPDILKLIYTEMPTEDKEKSNYYFGLFKGEVNGLTTYGHGGFWATAVNYYPELNASIAVFVLERDKRKLRKNIYEGIVGELQLLAK